MSTLTILLLASPILYICYGILQLSLLFIFTANAVFIKNGKNVQILREKGGSVSRCGRNTSLMSNDDSTMFGNKVGIKRDSTIHLYNERNKSYRICPGKTELRLSDLRDKSQARNKLLTQTKKPILR